MGQRLPARLATILFAVLPSAMGVAQDSKVSRVVVSACTLDRSRIPCASFKIKARVREQAIEVKLFLTEGGQFVSLIPDEFKTAKKLDLIVNTPNGWFELDQLDKSWWRESWELGLEHPPFSEDYAYLVKNKKTKCLGYLIYPNSEPGGMISTTNCN